MKKKIIDISIKQWHDRFTGISALDIAEKLDISHDETLRYLEELKKEKKGTLNENVTLYQISLDLSDKNSDFKLPEPKPVITHIYFPSKSILETYFQNNLKEFIENGEFTNRLHRGGNQIELIYFDIKVLAKYLDNKEIYSIDDDVTGGVIRLNSDYITTLSEKEVDKIFFTKIWYGKRKLANGNISVSAILNDLSGLNKREQSYWYCFEIEDEDFSSDDEDFNRFVSRAYYGNWTESKDPIKDIKIIIEELNNIFPFQLYSESENPYLRYPINNTFKEFADCNSELYKLIGPDNVKLSKLKRIYTKFLDGSNNDLIHKETKRPMSSMQVMDLILSKKNMRFAEMFKAHLEKVNQNRIEGDHKITLPNQNKIDYIEKFRQICYDSKTILMNLKIEYKKMVHRKNAYL